MLFSAKIQRYSPLYGYIGQLFFQPQAKLIRRALDKAVLFNCGLTMSGAISLFIHQSLSAQGLPFNVHGKDAQSGGIAPESADPLP